MGAPGKPPDCKWVQSTQEKACLAQQSWRPSCSPLPPASLQLPPTRGGRGETQTDWFPVGNTRAKLRIKSQPEQAAIRTGATAPPLHDEEMRS